MSDPSLFSQVAGLLRPVSKDVSNGQGKLCLSTVYLKKLNSAFDENVPEDLTSSFHLTDTKASLQLDLQFLLDLVKHTVALKVTPDLIGDDESNLVSLKRFTNIKTLEIHKIDVTNVLGIQRLRSQLQELTCLYNLETLCEILEKCGGDLSAPNLWSELRNVNFSHNRLLDIDGSLESTPWLNALDISYNQLTDLEFINVLPNLKYLNLSYNKLENVPRFRGPICKKLQVLLLNNNFIEDLSGLSTLQNVLQIDLRQNCIMDHQSFLSISHMPSLNFLNLQGNPIIFHPHHRTLTCNYLNKNTVTLKFVLDNIPLNKTEKSLAGSLYPISRSSLESSGKPRNILKADSVESSLHNSSHSSLENVSVSIERPKKVRTVNIQEGFEEIVVREKKTPKLTPKSTTGEHLEVKNKIEQLRQTHGSSWLSQHSGEIFQEVLGFDKNAILSSTPSDSSFGNTPFEGKKTVSVGGKSNNDTFLTAQTHLEQTVDVPKEKEVTEEREEVSSIYESFRSPSAEEEEEEILSDDEDLCDGEIFLASSVPDSEDYDLSIVVTDTHLSERDSVSSKQRARWHISVIKSCQPGDKPHEVQIVFDLLRSDRKSRTYYMEEADQFIKLIFNLMVKNKVQDKRIQYQCIKCNELFSRTKVSGVLLDGVTITCPKCDSNLVIESK